MVSKIKLVNENEINKKLEICSIGEGGEIFSKYKHPVLEDFIQKVIDQNKNHLPTKASQQLAREFFLYGFLRASGQDFGCVWWGADQKEDVKPARESGSFYTNNGVLALSDFDKEVYIRGGDSYHGYLKGSDEEPQAVEGTLLKSGYEMHGIFVPHSNGDKFANTRREKLFQALLYFSHNVRNLRGEPTQGPIVMDFSEPRPQAPYRARDPSLPRIVVRDIILIPGNKEITISLNQ